MTREPSWPALERPADSPRPSNLRTGDRVLVTTSEWFFAPDGRCYRGAWGTVRAIMRDEETLGIKTNARATNWYAQIGDTTIAGCQVHYVVRCDKPPPEFVDDHVIEKGVVVEFHRPTHIWNANASGLGDTP